MLIRWLCLLLLLFGLSWFCAGNDLQVHASTDNAAEQLIGVPQYPFSYADIGDDGVKTWHVTSISLRPSDYFMTAAAVGDGLSKTRYYLLDMLDSRSPDYFFLVHSPGQLRL